MNKYVESCAVYARYSSSNQNDASIEQQIEAAQKFASENKMVIVETYADRAISGTTDNRPDYQRMLSDSGSGRWTVLLTWKTDRIARNRYDAAVCKHILRKNGVRILYVKESVPDAPEGILLESFLEGLAEYYSVALAQNVRRGHLANAKDCKLNFRPPIGYRRGPDGRAEIDPQGAALVRDIFAKRVSGMRPGEIAREMNANGVPPIRGDMWINTSVEWILLNDMYRGVYHYGDIVVEGGVPAIIDEKTWSAVAATMHRGETVCNRKRLRLYILTGPLYCGRCGRPMTGCSGKYYRCSHRESAATPCETGSVRADELEDLVVSVTVDQLLAPDTVSWIADRVVELQAREEPGRGRELKEELAKTETGLDNIVKAVEAGAWSPTLQARLATLESERVRILQEIEDDAKEHPHLDRDLIIFYLEQFRDGAVGTPEERERLVSALIRRIEVLEDRVRITYNYGAPPSGPEPGPCYKNGVSGDSVLIIQDGMILHMEGAALFLDILRDVRAKRIRKT